MSFYSQYQPRVLVDLDFAITPWVSRDEVARCGALVLWTTYTEDLLPRLRKQFPTLQELPELVSEPDRPGTFYRFGVQAAIIRPDAGASPAACPPR